MIRYYLLFIYFVCNFVAFSQHKIDSISLFEKVKLLCSEGTEGRMPGSSGYDYAANVVEKHFAVLGLNQWESGSFRQFFSVESNKILDCNVSFQIENGKKIICSPGVDYAFRCLTGKGNVKGEVVFCGYGISIDNYNDYDGIDVKDKVVMCFKSNPPWKHTTFSNGEPTAREKALIAKQKGAKALIVISNPNSDSPQKPIGSLMESISYHVDIPQLHLNIETASQFFMDGNSSLKNIHRLIDSLKKPFSMNTKAIADISVVTSYNPHANTSNIIAVYKGSHPTLKDEYVILTSHLDHVGMQCGVTYFGANDNASGVASLMEIASIMNKEKINTDRSIVFAVFSCEEQGLLGSKHFVKNLKIPPEKIKAVFNLDCVASGDSIQLGNGISCPVLYNFAQHFNKEMGNIISQNTWQGGGADLTPFHEKGIPGLYLVSKFSYTHLHLPSDKPETLNKTLHAKITSLALQLILEISKESYSGEAVDKY